jgi:hypothetical protein
MKFEFHTLTLFLKYERNSVKEKKIAKNFASIYHDTTTQYIFRFKNKRKERQCGNFVFS